MSAREMTERHANAFMVGASPDDVWPLVRDHHYSRRMPANIQACYAVRGAGGLFGDLGEVLAACVFSVPPTRWSEEVLELSRLVRVPGYTGQLSGLLSFAGRRLRKNGHHLVVSFADWTHGHHGGIYQAAGWYFSGKRDRQMDGLLIDGIFRPGRSCNSAYGTRSPSLVAERLRNNVVAPHYDDGKYLYWRPLSIAGKTRAKRLGLQRLAYLKPDNAACPSDAPVPTGASVVQPHEAAP